jgi:hypothetical protein
MVTMFSQIWAKTKRGQSSRAIAGLCVVLWLAGSASTLYGSLAPQWTTPHCPQSHSSAAQHGHGSCVWHCDSIETQSASGRSWRPSLTPAGFLSGQHSATSDATDIHGGVTGRGPPQSHLFAMLSAIYKRRTPLRKPAYGNNKGWL